MSEYIKREDAIAEIMSIPSGTIHTDYAVFILDRIHAADVAEVVHAKWFNDGYYKTCSRCHSHYNRISKFCPMCGARMDGDAHV